MAQAELETDSVRQSPFRKLLLDAARPTLYHSNAFRITGLPVQASARDITRQASRLDIAARVGGTVPSGAGPFPLAPAPDRDSVRDAIDRLRDPERRLIEELFWFWPHDPSNGTSDAALGLLCRGETKSAIELWKSIVLSGADRGAAQHNLAICAHLCALETANPADAERWWRDAFHHWKLVLQDETCWSRFASRIVQLEDPRLTTGLVRRLRKDLPAVLVSISCLLVLRAAEANDYSTARQHAALIRNAGFEQESVREALRTALAPVRQRLRAQCDAVLAEVKANPRRAEVLVQNAITQLWPMLFVFDALFDAGDVTRDGARDEVAVALSQAVETQLNETDGWLVAATLYEQLLSIAARETTRSKFLDRIEKLKQYAASGHDWCVAGYFDLPASVLEMLQAARSKAKTAQWAAAIQPIAFYIARSGDLRPAVLAPLAYCLTSRALSDRKKLVDRSPPPHVVRAELPAIAEALLLSHELMPDDPFYRSNVIETKELFDKIGLTYPSTASLRRTLGIAHLPIPTITPRAPASAAAAAPSGCLVALAAMLALVFITAMLFRIGPGRVKHILERRSSWLAARSISASTSVPPTAASPVSKGLPFVSSAITNSSRPRLRPYIWTAPTPCGSAGRRKSGWKTTATMPYASSSLRWAPTARRNSSAAAGG